MNPYNKFKLWFNLAKKDKKTDPTAFALGTINKNSPNIRMVLLKYVKPNGFVFFTNLNSVKGKNFLKNQNLSMCFYWESINRQVRINGKGDLISEEDSDKYFLKRPRGSQIGAWASNQSSEIPNNKYLKKRVAHYEKKYFGLKIPRPKYWRGIIIKPKNFEFWSQGDYRLHNREFYFLRGGVWNKKILSP